MAALLHRLATFSLGPVHASDNPTLFTTLLAILALVALFGLLRLLQAARQSEMNGAFIGKALLWALLVVAGFVAAWYGFLHQPTQLVPTLLQGALTLGAALALYLTGVSLILTLLNTRSERGMQATLAIAATLTLAAVGWELQHWPSLFLAIAEGALLASVVTLAMTFMLSLVESESRAKDVVLIICFAALATGFFLITILHPTGLWFFAILGLLVPMLAFDAVVDHMGEVVFRNTDYESVTANTRRRWYLTVPIVVAIAFAGANKTLPWLARNPDLTVDLWIETAAVATVVLIAQSMLWANMRSMFQEVNDELEKEMLDRTARSIPTFLSQRDEAAVKAIRVASRTRWRKFVDWLTDNDPEAEVAEEYSAAGKNFSADLEKVEQWSNGVLNSFDGVGWLFFILPLVAYPFLLVYHYIVNVRHAPIPSTSLPVLALTLLALFVSRGAFWLLGHRNASASTRKARRKALRPPRDGVATMASIAGLFASAFALYSRPGAAATTDINEAALLTVVNRAGLSYQIHLSGCTSA